jgi:hypothetical protein
MTNNENRVNIFSYDYKTEEGLEQLLLVARLKKPVTDLKYLVELLADAVAYYSEGNVK